ncbi:MAG TPA: hypothetical protein VKB76_01410 [Ktedonobacterales bacterium]|nr:hypothetical protein [Ktedonobacterales bacterium]
MSIACTIALAGLLVPVAIALALECPEPQALAGPGILKETPAQTQRIADLLATGDDDNRIRIIADDLRARYPGVQNAEIANYLMAAYCPVVAKMSGVSEQEMQARMDRFVSQLSRIIY